MQDEHRGLIKKDMKSLKFEISSSHLWSDYDVEMIKHTTKKFSIKWLKNWKSVQLEF